MLLVFFYSAAEWSVSIVKSGIGHVCPFCWYVDSYIGITMVPSNRTTMFTLDGQETTDYHCMNIAPPTKRKRTIYCQGDDQVFTSLKQVEEAKQHIGKMYYTETATTEDDKDEVVFVSFSGNSMIKYARDGVKLYASMAAAKKALRQMNKKKRRAPSVESPPPPKKSKVASPDFSHIMLRVVNGEITMKDAARVIQSDASIWNAMNAHEKTLWSRI